VWIYIPVSICATAKTAGRQYTKQILPDFLQPYARICLDVVIEAVREKERGVEQVRCARIIGSIDLGTVRRHLTRLEEAASLVSLFLAER